MYSATFFSIFTLQINLILNQDLDFLIPTFEIDLPTQKTTTRIYLDFMIFTLTETESEEIFNFFKFLHQISTSAPGELSPILKNVLNDLSTMKRSLRHLNSITIDLLNLTETKPPSSHCTYSRYILSKDSLVDLMESLLLIKNKFPSTFALSTEDKLNPSSENFKQVAESLLTLKGIVHEFISYFETQYSLLNELENFKIPNLIPHNLNLDNCIRTSGKETFHLQKVKYYNNGVRATIKLIQSHDFHTFYSIQPVPIAGIILDVENLFSPITDNFTYFHQICSKIHESKTCLLHPFQNPCLEAVQSRHVATILRACPIKLTHNPVPFLTLYGIFIPAQTDVSLLDPATQSISQNFSAPLNPFNLPYLLRSEFTVEATLDDITYLFGPTNTFTDILVPYINSEDLTLIHYFIKPHLNPSYQIYFSLITGLSITTTVIIGLSVRIFKQKRSKPIKPKYSVSLHKARTPTFIKINR